MHLWRVDLEMGQGILDVTEPVGARLLMRLGLLLRDGHAALCVLDELGESMGDTHNGWLGQASSHEGKQL